MKSGVEIKVLRGQIEIRNFLDTCVVLTLADENPARIEREGVERYMLSIAESPFGTDGQQFQVSVIWEGMKDEDDLVPDWTARMGVRLCLLSESESCFIRFRASIVNQDPSKNKVAKFQAIRKMTPEEPRGWGPKVEGGNNGLLPLSEVSDPSKGWLHDGVLRIMLKLEVYNQGQSTANVAVGSDSLLCLSKDLEALLSSGCHTDVVVKVGDEELRAHSLILMARSSVFASMLTLPMMEALQRTVNINDLSMKSIKALIGFMYTGQVDQKLLDSDSDILEIIQAAHRYAIPSLLELCVNLLRRRPAVETVCEWLHVADLIGDATWKSECLEFMHVRMSEIQSTDNFAKLVAAHAALLAEVIALMAPPAKRART